MHVRDANKILIPALTWLLLLGLPGQLISQSKQELQRQLRLSNQFIAKNKNKELSFESFNLLREQIRIREKLLKNLNGEIQDNEAELRELDALICKMEEDIQLLKTNYARTARETYLNHDQDNFWLSLFSSGSLSEAYYRLQYYRQFSRHRQQQIELLAKSQKYLMEKSLRMSEIRRAKTRLAQNRVRELQDIQTDKHTAKKMSSSLKSRYKTYTSNRKKSEQVLKAAVSSTDKGWEAVYSSTQADDKPNFSSRKGLLSWPVKRSRCIVTGKYGKTEDAFGNPITNDGIFIRTQAGEPILAVYSGVVTAVQNLPLGGKMVVIAHGDYRTTYSNLEGVLVKKGERVSSGQKIAQVYTDSRAGESVLQFLIYKLPGEFVDPELWLADYSRGMELEEEED